jgi:hypothetical protein
MSAIESITITSNKAAAPSLLLAIHLTNMIFPFNGEGLELSSG